MSRSVSSRDQSSGVVQEYFARLRRQRGPRTALGAVSDLSVPCTSLMPPPRRSPILPVTLAALAALVLVCTGIYLGGHPDSLPAPLRNALVSDDVRTTQEAFAVIK